MSINVVPSLRGRLPNELDMERYFGYELEFAPDPYTQQQWAVLFLAAGFHNLQNTRHCSNRHSDTPSHHNVEGAGDLWHPEYLRDVNCTSEGCSCRLDYADRTIGSLHDDIDATAALAETAQGFGIVTENRPAYQVAADLPVPDAPYRNWRLITDSTAGLEMLAPPLKMSDNLPEVLQRLHAVTEDNGAQMTTQCGAHVHVSVYDLSNRQRFRLYGLYRYLEALFAACMAPNRYFRTMRYNQPLWNSRRGGDTVLVEGAEVFRWTGHGSFFNTSAYREHGTFEFRTLESSHDYRNALNWMRLINRFVQVVATDGTMWGAKAKSFAPISVDTGSIRAFINHLDLNRKDISDDLKEARDWYLERVRTYYERSTFRRTLRTGMTDQTELPHNVSLKLLRDTGKTMTGVEAFVIQDLDGLTNTEIGREIQSIIARMVNYGGLRDNYVDPLTTLNPDSNTFAHIVEFALEYLEDAECESYFTIEDIETFYLYLYNSDIENLGQWYREIVEGVTDEQKDTICAVLSRVTQVWSSFWTRNTMNNDDTAHVVKSILAGGSDQCADF